MTMITAFTTCVCALSCSLGLMNGDFSRISDGLADGWQQIGRYELVRKGGRNGVNAIRLESTAGETSAALQKITFAPPHNGPFTITAWVRIDEIGEGGDCSLWLDVMQEDGSPIWGIQEVPDRWKTRRWQKVTAEVRPTHSVSEVQVYLMLRGVWGSVRFCDVRAALGTAVEPTEHQPRPNSPNHLWWVADSMTRVFQDDEPPQKPARQVVLDLARNERESFQVCIKAGAEKIRQAQVRVSDLKSGSNSLPPVEWFRVGYVWVEKPMPHPYSPRKTGAWWPDPLLPPYEFDVDPGEVQPLWFTVHAPSDAKPGAYTGMITITAGAESLRIQVKVTVHNTKLPLTGYMKTAFALMDGHLRKLYGKITPQLRRKYTDFLLQHRLNPDDISRTTLPDLNELSYANTRGLNAFNILNVVPEPKTDVLWVCFAELDEYTPEFKQRFFERLDEFVPELEKRGLIDKAYIYGFDERGPEYIPIIKDFFGEIKKRYPRVHTLSTCWPPAGTDPLSLSIDWYVPLSSSYDPKLAANVRKRGGEMWWYVCCGPGYPCANWMLEFPLIEARLIWWQAFQYDVDGFLYWGLNIWERKNNDKPIPNNSGPRLDWSLTSGWNGEFHGDGVLLLPGEHGPLSTIRLENIRDGLEDIELLRQYRRKQGVRAALKIVQRVSKNRTAFTRDPSDLLSARRLLLQAL